jgi:naphtho-gamma-pyrone polyketide synthase
MAGAYLGVASLAKALLMMRKNVIPPHCRIRTRINHKYPLDLKERNVHISLKETPWIQVEGKPREVLINNFSAAGGDTALLLEGAPGGGCRGH